jgi:hypothetical protein
MDSRGGWYLENVHCEPIAFPIPYSLFPTPYDTDNHMRLSH